MPMAVCRALRPCTSCYQCGPQGPPRGEPWAIVEPDTDTDADTDSDTDADTETGTDTDTNTQTQTRTGTRTHKGTDTHTQKHRHKSESGRVHTATRDHYLGEAPSVAPQSAHVVANMVPTVLP